MKTFTVTKTIFTPGIAGVGTISFPDLPNFSIDRLIAVINQTQGVLVYSTGSPQAKYTAVSGSTVTLNIDTASHQSTDVIQVIYNSADTDNGMLGVIADTSIALRAILNALLRPLWVSNAGRVLATVDTVSTVGTVSVVTNLSSVAGFDIKSVLLYPSDRNSWANTIRRNIT
jgi:hypothetical protein